MFLNLLFSSLIAAAAITPSPTPSTTSAQMQNQSVSSNPSSPVVLAAKNHRFWFRLYVTWIVIAAIASAFLTWMLWKSGNRQQDAVISETNERTAKLESETAEATLKLAELKKKQEPRGLNMEEFGKALKDKPQCEIEILYQPGDNEAYLFGIGITLGLISGGWQGTDQSSITPIPIPADAVPALGPAPKGLPDSAVQRMKQLVDKHFITLPPVMRAGARTLPSKSGVFIAANKVIPPPLDGNTPYGALVNAFTVAGIVPEEAVAPDLPDNKLRIIVGSKP